MNGDKNNKRGLHCCCSGMGFGILLLIIGGFFIFQDLGWVPTAVSFWPVALTAIGAYFIVKELKK